MTPNTILDRILEKVEARVNERKASTPLRDCKFETKSKNRFIDTFRRRTPLPRIIAEIKFKSPSEGELRKTRDATEVARDYILNGASALSILTESDFFDGSHEYLRQVRLENPDVPLLCKDFVIDDYQILEAKLAGADAILLMVSVLGNDIQKFMASCDRYNIDALVEVHDEVELEIALNANARMIGVNNRDLKILQVSLKTSEDLIAKIPSGIVTISESGLFDLATIQQLSALGYHGFLVGTAFMKARHPGERLAALLGRPYVQG